MYFSRTERPDRLAGLGADLIGPFLDRCPKGSTVAHRFQGSRTNPNRPGTATWVQCERDPQPKAAPAPRETTVNVQTATQVSPNIQTQITPTVSPTFTQVQDSPNARTASATTAQNPSRQDGGGISADDLAQILAQQDAARAEREAAARRRREEERRQREAAAAAAAEERARREAEARARQREEERARQEAAAAERRRQREAAEAAAAQRRAEQQRAQEQYEKDMAAWRQQVKEAQASGAPAPIQPQPVQAAPIPVSSAASGGDDSMSFGGLQWAIAAAILGGVVVLSQTPERKRAGK